MFETSLNLNLNPNPLQFYNVQHIFSTRRSSVSDSVSPSSYIGIFEWKTTHNKNEQYSRRQRMCLFLISFLVAHSTFLFSNFNFVRCSQKRPNNKLNSKNEWTWACIFSSSCCFAVIWLYTQHCQPTLSEWEREVICMLFLCFQVRLSRSFFSFRYILRILFTLFIVVVVVVSFFRVSVSKTRYNIVSRIYKVHGMFLCMCVLVTTWNDFCYQCFTAPLCCWFHNIHYIRSGGEREFRTRRKKKKSPCRIFIY